MAETIRWSQVKDKLLELNQSQMLDVIKDLFDRSKESREFLVARLGAGKPGASLEMYRKKIVEQFAPAEGFAKLKLSVARQAIRDYRKATRDLPGALDLMLTYVEYGTETARNSGDMWESYYDSLLSVFGEAAKMLRSLEGQALYDSVRERLLKIERLSHGIGWGYGDMITQEMDHLREFLGVIEE